MDRDLSFKLFTATSDGAHHDASLFFAHRGALTIFPPRRLEMPRRCHEGRGEGGDQRVKARCTERSGQLAAVHNRKGQLQGQDEVPTDHYDGGRPAREKSSQGATLARCEFE